MNDTPLSSSASESVESASLPAVPQWERLVVTLLIVLNVGLLLARLSGSEPLQSANDRSRWCTVWTLSARGTYIIDEIIENPKWDTIDKVRHEGHFYSTKPPLYPTMLAGIYRVLHEMTGWSLITETETVTQIIILLVNLIPFGIALYYFWKLLRCYDFPSEIRILGLALLAFATPLLPYLTVLNNHTIAATSLIFALYGAARIQRLDPQTALNHVKKSRLCWWYLVAGFFAAFTCCNELPAALFGIAIFLILVRHDWKRTWCWFVPAALVPLIAFFVTNVIATGGWKPFYMYYGTEKYVYEHWGVPSYWSDPRGVDKARDSVPTYIFHCLLGHHGIFSLTPVFLLMIPGLVRGLRRRVTWQKIWYGVAGLLTLAILAFYWKRTENYNYGGVSVALRWTLWLTPFWLLLVAESLRKVNRPRIVSSLLILFALPSLFSAWAPWNTPWQQPWLFNVMSEQGWIDYSDAPPKLDQPLHSWLLVLPDSSDANPDYWAEFDAGDGTVVRLADAGPAQNQAENARRLSVVRKKPTGEVIRRRELSVSRAEVVSGADPNEFLLDWTDSRSQATREEQVELLRGMPDSRGYQRGFDKYIFVPEIREDAFRCLKVASRVYAGQGEALPQKVARSDLWLSSEVPFGLVKSVRSLTLREDGSLVSRETWRLLDCGMTLEDTAAEK